MKQDASIGTNILRVSASDEDADNNGAIVYSLTAPVNPNDLEYFEIQAESGWIVLKKPLDVSALVCPLFVLTVFVLRDLDCSQVDSFIPFYYRPFFHQLQNNVTLLVLCR